MSLGYQLAYRIGLTPWERAGRAGTQQLTDLLDREEADRTRPLGRALDLGCGTGMHTIELARRGWTAIGIDAVERAIAKARGRQDADRARFVVGDITDLDHAGLGGDIDFFLDVGCFHGLDDDQRAAVVRGISALAAPRATLLMLAFRHGSRPLLPRGVDRPELAQAFSGWDLLTDEPADTSGMPGPLKRTAPHWFRLQRLG